MGGKKRKIIQSSMMLQATLFSEAHYSATSGLGPKQRITIFFLYPQNYLELYGIILNSILKPRNFQSDTLLICWCWANS